MLRVPQGQVTMASSARLVSGQVRVMVRFPFPDWEGIVVVVDRQPSTIRIARCIMLLAVLTESIHCSCVNGDL